MEQYTAVSYQLSQQLTDAYSTSFGWSIRLIPKASRRDVYALYGLVRVADEIVDSYRGPDAAKQLDDFEQQTYDSIDSGYSANPIIQAFAATARHYAIPKELITAFFHSMRLDLTKTRHTQKSYTDYIYGSAEVVGLMMLRLFVSDAEYKRLEPAARHLGAAYQKVNFLRDIAADHAMGRWYFPNGDFTTFDDTQKAAIEADIAADLTAGEKGIRELPESLRGAVSLSAVYYRALLEKIEQQTAVTLKSSRIRIPNTQKLWLLMHHHVKGRR